jgi:hypothetical protein
MIRDGSSAVKALLARASTKKKEVKTNNFLHIIVLLKKSKNNIYALATNQNTRSRKGGI